MSSRRISAKRLAAAVATVEAVVDQHMAGLTDAAGRHRELLYALKRLTLPPPVPAARPGVAAAPVVPAPARRPAAGSVAGRIPEIVGETDDGTGVTFASLMGAKPGAPAATVRYHLQRLVRAGWLVAMGATSNRCYRRVTTRGKGRRS